MKNANGKRRLIFDWIIIAAVLICTVAIFLNREKISEFRQYGYISVLVLCFFSNATVFLPAPSLVVVISMAQILSPPIVAVVGALGSTLGETIGYLMGRTSVGVSARMAAIAGKISMRIHKTEALVLILALLPLPLFDFGGVYAGARKMNPMLFFGVCYLGKLIKMLIIVYASKWVVGLIL